MTQGKKDTEYQGFGTTNQTPMEIVDYTRMDNTEYNRKQQELSMQKRVSELNKTVSAAEYVMSLPATLLTIMMDRIELVIKNCGGESKVNFLDVSSTMIKISTRVPMTANLFSFMPESDDNPRFHKVVTKVLVMSPNVAGVRWLPTETAGAVLIVSLKDLGA